ncbi:MAG TPA: branched-chain amino acid ABC transporter substrate-binding protein [Burkholderiales bacterium]|nr:branched-chain amino acid ABC transporter substrate-binding protein [Burkholderiales bacterium]
MLIIQRRRALLACAALLLSLTSSAEAAEPIKIALIGPQSGPFANIGMAELHAFQAEFDRVNAQGGALGRRLELIALDNKSSPQETTLMVQAAIDQGARYIVQGAGSNNGHAVNDAVAKHSSRNPQRAVLYLNHGALDPALTTEKCNFWHFRFVPHGHMIMTMVADAVARNSNVKRVYLINQDYVWGHGVAKDARAMLAVKRPDIEIVGEDLHPLGKVKDFAPYVAKMRAARADAVVTGNWGNDLALLVKAAKDAGLNAEMHAPIASLQGSPTMIAESGADRVRAVVFWHMNLDNNPLRDFALSYKAKYKEDWVWLPQHLLPQMLVMAMSKAGSDDPVKVAFALEDMRYNGPTGEVWMRPDDHQLMTPLYQVVFTRAGQPGVKYDAENTGLGWKTEGQLGAKDVITPARCKVQRP